MKLKNPERESIQMAQIIEKCEFCEENDVDCDAEIMYVLNETKCMENGICPTACNLKDWVVYCCKKCIETGEQMGQTFGEYIGVPTGEKDSDYFTIYDYPSYTLSTLGIVAE